jgi:hypothetical protein
MIGGLWRFLKGSFHGAFCKDESCDCRRERSLGGAVGLGAGPPNYDFYPDAPKILQRFPKYPLGARLLWRGVTGPVVAIYPDYDAAMPFVGYSPEWYEIQMAPPSSKDQVFYSLLMTVERKGRKVATGTVLAGENDVELASMEA